MIDYRRKLATCKYQGPRRRAFPPFGGHPLQFSGLLNYYDTERNEENSSTLLIVLHLTSEK